MKNNYKALLLSISILSILPLYGCAGKVSPNAVNFEVNTNWTATSRCSSTSPEIKVTSIPPSTEKLKVSLVDLNMMSYNHGGGTFMYDGSNIIPLGALNSFNGPCPPSGQHEYRITVKAVDSSGMTIGFGSDTQSL
jgi:hypothetical protein